MADAIDPSQVQWDDAAPAPLQAPAEPNAPIDASKVKWDDAPASEAPDTGTPFQDAWGTVKHQGAQLLKGGANAVAALPLMAEDFGVAARNVAGDAANKAMGKPATPDYELPSTTFHQGMDQIFGAPQNAAERVNDVLIPTILSAGAASSGR